MRNGSIPVTILSGSLGAGKTTLLNYLLHEAGNRDLAVLVNDMGEMNIDADLVSNSSDLSVTGGGVTELSNGCICCELQDDLNEAVVRLARERDFDHLVVESSGISEPGPVARLFTTGSRAAAMYEVDSLVTVVDTRLFYDTFGGGGVVERQWAEDGDGEDGEFRPLSDLLVEQVELSDVVVLNKCDLVSETELAEVEELVRSLRPDADLIPATYSEVDPAKLLGRELYDPATAAESAGWKQVLDGHDESDTGGTQEKNGHSHDHDHSHPEEVYGVTSFPYRRRRPFHPGRLEALLSDLPASVIRSKGTCWVAGREDVALTLGQAGPSARIEVSGRWVASLPEFEQDAYRRNRSNLEWDEEWGDRRTELVFIGRGMDHDAVRDALDDCLLTDEEMDVDWSDFESVFPTEPEEALVLAEPTRDD